MTVLLEDVIKLFSIIAVFPVFFTFIRYCLNVFNRSIVELVILPARVRVWEDFLEKILLITILIGTSIFSTLLGNTKLSERIISCLLNWMTSILFLIIIVIFIAWILSFFITRIKEYSKVITTLIMIALMILFLYLPLIICVLKQQLISRKITISLTEIVFVTIGIIILYSVIFITALKCSNYFHRRQKRQYKIESLDVSNLSNLIFIYSLNDDVQVFYKYPEDIQKIKMPFYIFYPKEKNLYRVYDGSKEE
ncbi:hypothetical protein [Paenibacillus sp. 79R4]|uniref:hypothetical protein n=1 Tax=Paenibacillus sp. 79R4 TaxID=2212847 RepID=UPI0015BD64E2|nr:hypothetical protein [Paenibacillus sp. 79R4]